MIRSGVLVAILVAGCSACGGAKKQRTYPEPPAVDLVTHVRETRQRAESLRAETKADVWLSSERAKVTVLMLAQWGGRLRFQAQNPNDSMAADLAADGEQYCFLNSNDNCGECGPATAEGVGRLLGLVMEPDDLVFVLLGSTPILDGEATVSWDASDGTEVLDLTAANGFKQKIKLSGGGRAWDVVQSEVWGPDGKRLFKIRHKGFHEVARPDGRKTRLPSKSEIEQGKQNALIEWKSQELDVDMPDARFKIDVPAGLRACQ